MSETVTLTLEGPIAQVRLNRPDKGNALDLASWQALADGFATINQHRSIKAVVLSGAGKHFCVGADIDEFEVAYASRVSVDRYFDAVAAATNTVARCPVPVIAAIQGACFGGAVGLAVAADLRVAAPEAKFAITPAKLGLVYPYDDLRRVMQLLGPARTKDLIFTARTVFAPEAQEMGLVNQMAQDPLSSALDTAKTIATLAPNAVVNMKRMMADVLAGQQAETPSHRALIHQAIGGLEYAEGVHAFKTKRQAQFGDRT